jgi:hypothetical protein
MAIDCLSTILPGVGDHVAEPERKNDDGDYPENVDRDPMRPARRATERITTITTSDTWR